MVRALHGLDIPASVNERNDICVDKFKMSPPSRRDCQFVQSLTLLASFHVSGSAFKLVNARAYHHGTMLIDAKLGDLRGVLGNSRVGGSYPFPSGSSSLIHCVSARQDTMVTKGVASVSSSVRNLREWSSTIDHDSFVDAVVREFKATYGGGSVVQVPLIVLS